MPTLHLRGDNVDLPFTAQQFFDVFRNYNEAIWPAQFVLNAIAVIAALAAYRANLRQSRRAAQTANVLIAILWLWTGVVYHGMFFRTITPAGGMFAAFFVAEAAVLLFSAWRVSPVSRASNASLAAGTALIAYALVLYPAIGFVLGQRYPEVPSFGAPCPMTIFTFGIICLLPLNVPRIAVVIPVLWAVLGLSAAVSFGVRQDVGLPASAAVVLLVKHYARRMRIAGHPV